MGLKAIITNITRSDMVVNVEFDIVDDVTKETLAKRVIPYGDGSNLTQALVRADIIKIATEYKNTTTKEATLKSNIGVEITIP